MTTAKISDLNDLTPPMDGTELLEIERGGASFCIRSADITQAPSSVVPITSGAAPVDLSPLVRVYEVTTGGTGGAEVLNLPNPNLDGDGANDTLIGKMVTVKFKTRTAVGDYVTFTNAGVNSWSFLDGGFNGPASYVRCTDLRINQSYTAVTFVWAYDTWLVWGLMTDGAAQYTATPQDLNLSPLVGQNVLMQNLPIEDPHVADALWNDSGALKISAG